MTGASTFSGTNFIFGPVITDGTGATAAMSSLAVQLTSSGFPYFFYRTSTSATLTANGVNTGRGHFVTGAILYLRVEYDASNSFLCSMSGDGVTWHQIETAIARTMTPTHVGFGWNTNNSTADDSGVAIDYVRIVTV